MKICSAETYLLGAILATSSALLSTGHAGYGLYSEYNRMNNLRNEMVINNKNLSTDKLEKNNTIKNHQNGQITNDILLATIFSLIAVGFTSLALLKDKQKIEG